MALRLKTRFVEDGTEASFALRALDLHLASFSLPFSLWGLRNADRQST